MTPAPSARRPGLYFERTIAALAALLVMALVVWVCVEILEEFGRGVTR